MTRSDKVEFLQVFEGLAMIYLSATCKNSQELTKTKRHLSFFKRRSILPERSISSTGRAFGEEKDEGFPEKRVFFIQWDWI